MALEIERKFLVLSADFKKESSKRIYIKQGFLNSDKHRVVRIRTADNTAWLTIKGISQDKGLSRYEWEKEIPIHEAQQLLLLSENKPIEKIRYLIRTGDHTIEVDEFLGVNEGLIVAEVELRSKEETFEKPSWLGKEVTGKKKYYNSKLSRKPYTKWKKKASK